MKSNPNDLMVYEGQTILDAVQVIEANFVRCVVVVNEEDKVIQMMNMMQLEKPQVLLICLV